MKKNILILLTLILTFATWNQTWAGLYFSPATGWSWNRLTLKATAKEQWDYCQELEKANLLNSAVSHYRLLIRVFPESPEAVESIYRVGELLIQQKRWNTANKYYEKLLEIQITETSKLIHRINRKKRSKKNVHTDAEKRELLDISLHNLQNLKSGGSPVLQLDVNRIFKSLYQIGQAYQSGTRYKLFDILPLWKQKGKFVAVYRSIIARSPNFEFSPHMQKEIALYLLKKKEHYAAKLEFESLLYNYSLSPEAQDSSYYIGLCRFGDSRGAAYNQENMNFAESGMRDYLLSQPSGKQAASAKEYLGKIDEQRAENHLIKIKFFVRRHQWKAAKIYIDEMTSKFPKSKFTTEAQAIAARYKDISNQL